MSLSSWLARVFGRQQADVVVSAAVADDGSGDAPDPGELSPLRADPATGAVLVKDVGGGGGGGGGTVDQGAPGASSWKVVENNSADVRTAAETLAGTVGTSDPATNAPAVAVRNVQSMAVSAGVAAPGATAQSVYVIQAGSGAPVLDGNGDERLGVVVMPGSTTNVTGDRAVPVPVQGSDLTNAYELAGRDEQTDGSQKTQITDGTNSAAVVNSAPSTEYGLVVRPIPSGTQTVDTELPAAAVLVDNTATPTAPAVGSFGLLYNGSQWLLQRSDSAGRAVVAGNVANGSTAALPVTIGGVNTSGNSYPLVGTVVGNGVHLFVAQGNSGAAWAVDTELPAASTLANNTPNPTAPAVGAFPHVWDAATGLWQRAAGSTSGAQMVAFDRAHLGPFGHLIAQPLTYITQITFTYGVNSQLGGSTVSGTGATVDASGGLLRVQSGTGSTASAAYLSNRPLLYRAGQGMGMIWSQAFTTGLANNTTIAGPSTDASNADGYFFGYKGTSFGIHHYRGGSEVSFTAQASWNGSVPSGFDPTKLNVYEVRYPYLGAGDVFFYLQDPTTGRSTLVHTIRYANSSTLLQVSNPTMKFLARSVNAGNTTNLTTTIGSIGMYVVGTRHFNGPPFAYNNQKSVTGGTETSIFSVRAATTLNGVTNRGAARLRLTTCVGDNGNTITAFFVKSGATVGGTPAFSPYLGSTADNGVTLTGASSMLSFDTAGTTATGGTAIYNSGCARNGEVVLPVADYDFVILPGETWTFSASPGANSNCAIFVSGVEEW